MNTLHEEILLKSHYVKLLLEDFCINQQQNLGKTVKKNTAIVKSPNRYKDLTVTQER